MYGYILFDVFWDLIFNSALVESISEATGISLQTMKDYLNAVQGKQTEEISFAIWEMRLSSAR